MGLVLLVVIWLITFISTYFFIAKTWWLPVGASAAAAGIDHHFTTTYILMGIVFVAAQVALGYLVWSYRDRGSAFKASYSHGNTTLEIVWTVLTTILFVGLNLTSSSIWASERFRAAASDSVQGDAVRVVLPVHRTGWKVWRDESGTGRCFGRW
jgi:cytochrome c oxidase subunit 2